MSIFIAWATNLSSESLAQGLSRIREWYGIGPSVMQDSTCFGNLGTYFAWRPYENQKPFHYSRKDDGTAFLTHVPYGYSRKFSAVPGDLDFAYQVGKALKGDPERITDFAAPLISVFTDRRSFVHIATDGIGLGRIYRYRTRSGDFISNRPVAAILLSGEVPGPSEKGWASQLMFGYFWDDLSPFEGITTFTAGEYATLTPDGVQIGAINAVKTWVAGEAEPLFDGFDRTLAEMQQVISLERAEANLSGGRDSRATAALLTAHLGERVKLQTSYPPLVEADTARPLIERLPYFRYYDGPDRAYSGNGALIWTANNRHRGRITQGLMERARIHLRNYQGAIVATHMMNGVAPIPMFSGDYLSIGLGGDGGEISKAYGWADVKVPGAVLKAIREVPVAHRMRNFTLTSDGSLGMLSGTRFATDFWPMLSQSRVKAGLSGLNGYKFLNYHLLITRVGRAQGLGFTDRQLPLFLGPHYISAALREPVNNMVRATMHDVIIDHYRPEWKGMPFEDALKVAPERRAGVPPRAVVYSGITAPEFREIINTKEWFGEPYDHAAILRVYAEQSAAPGLLNQRAYDLVFRAGFMNLLEDLRQVVPRKWGGADGARAISGLGGPIPDPSSTAPIGRLPLEPTRRAPSLHRLPDAGDAAGTPIFPEPAEAGRR